MKSVAGGLPLVESDLTAPVQVGDLFQLGGERIGVDVMP